MNLYWRTKPNDIHQILVGKHNKKFAYPIWRLCEQHVESIDHLVSGCPILTPKESKDQHFYIEHYIHWKIYQYNCAPHAEKLYEY